MKRLKLIPLLLMFGLTILNGQDLSGIPGAFADIGFGARPVAIGGAYVGLANDVNSVIWNPAGLVYMKNYQASFSYTNQLGLINYNFLAVAMPLGKSKGLGFSVITSGDKALREWTFGTSYAQEIWGFYTGVTLKLRYASFGNNSLNQSDFIVFDPDEISQGLSNQVKGTAFGFGFDLGILYPLSNVITLGTQLRDIYSPVFWNSSTDNTSAKTKGKYSETIPFEWTFGSSFKVTRDFLFALDYSPAILSDSYQKIMAGIEIKFIDLLYIRGGVQNLINNIDDERYSLGLGLDIGDLIGSSRILIDYTYSIEEFANSQRFSLGMEF